MLTVVPSRFYQLGNALSAVGSMMFLARELGARLYYPHMRKHAGVFESFDGVESEISLEEFSRLEQQRAEVGANRADFVDRLQSAELIWRNDWFEVRRIAPNVGALLGYRRGRYAPLELLDRAAFNGLQTLIVPAPYHLQWQKARPEIGWLREHLALNKKLLQEETAHNDQLRQHGRQVIGVHLRLGDYQSWRDGRYFFDVPTVAKVLRTCERWNRGRFAFRLFTNDEGALAALASQSRIGEAPISHIPGTYERDFIALSNCDFLLGPPSSFAHWAAFLGNRPRIVLLSIPYSTFSLTPVLFDTAQPVNWPFSTGLCGEFWIN